MSHNGRIRTQEAPGDESGRTRAGDSRDQPGALWAITPTTVVAACSGAFGIGPAEILSDSRAAHVVAVRHVAIWLARHLSGLSYPALGRAFGRDHSSIMHAEQMVEVRMAASPRFAAQVDGVMAALLDGTPVPGDWRGTVNTPAACPGCAALAVRVAALEAVLSRPLLGVPPPERGNGTKD